MPHSTPLQKSLVPVVMTVGASDSSGVSGIQADLRTITELGCQGASCVTCVTAQTPTGKLTSMHSIPESSVKTQMETVLQNMPVRAIKIGLLHSKAMVDAVIEVIQDFKKVLPVVIDVTNKTSQGDELCDDDTMTAICENMLQHADVVIAGLDDAQLLLGNSALGSGDVALANYDHDDCNKSVNSVDDMKWAARRIVEAYDCGGCLIRSDGGQKRMALGEGNNCADGSTNVLVIEGVHEAILLKDTSFCAPQTIFFEDCLSSAVSAYLAKGYSLENSSANAQGFVADLTSKNKQILTA
eukprot:GHVL01001327.1.p1 GENE.GHVL01001327.1~~GHVL01001327.1.p1  ORF type:complete len:298 (+),score=51.40 GHVL01001327.1:67-960(+)